MSSLINHILKYTYINIPVYVDATLQNTKLHFTLNFLIQLKKFIIC